MRERERRREEERREREREREKKKKKELEKRSPQAVRFVEPPRASLPKKFEYTMCFGAGLRAFGLRVSSLGFRV